MNIAPVDFEILRYSSQHDSTLGLLFHVKRRTNIPLLSGGIRDPQEGERLFTCYTLEDQFQTEKVMGESRIPAGRYRLTLRTFGDHHKRYSLKFQGIHQGMIEVMDVPNFQHILWHIGNTDDDTAGCLLLGNTAEANLSGQGRIGNSTSAYRRVYPIVAQAILNQDEVWVRYTNLDTVKL